MEHWLTNVTGSLLCASALLVLQTAQASPCPGTNVIENPEPFVWTYHPVSANNPEAYYSGTLVAGEETFQIGSDTLTTRAYGQEGQPLSIPAPTMHLRSMKDGDTYGDAALKQQALSYFEQQVAKGPGQEPGARYYESKVLGAVTL